MSLIQVRDNLLINKDMIDYVRISSDQTQYTLFMGTRFITLTKEEYDKL